MELKNFISSHDVDMASERIDNNTMFEMSSLLSFDFGTELVTYIQKYGYLGYRYVEFCGINARQMERSDMVKQTLALRARCPQTDKYVVLEMASMFLWMKKMPSMILTKTARPLRRQGRP